MGTALTFDWTDAAIAQLTELWLDGVTGGEIGRQMGLSRSAVMGKLRRLDLLCRDRPRLPVMARAPAQKLLKTTEQVSKPPKKAPKKPAKTPDRFFAEFAAKPPPPPPPEPAIGSFSLLDLRHGQCRWPGPEDRPPWSFCGARQAFDSSYCPEHHALAHNRGSQRDFDRMAAQALGGKLFASRAGVEQ